MPIEMRELIKFTVNNNNSINEQLQRCAVIHGSMPMVSSCIHLSCYTTSCTSHTCHADKPSTVTQLT